MCYKDKDKELYLYSAFLRGQSAVQQQEPTLYKIAEMQVKSQKSSKAYRQGGQDRNKWNNRVKQYRTTARPETVQGADKAAWGQYKTENRLRTPKQRQKGGGARSQLRNPKATPAAPRHGPPHRLKQSQRPNRV